MAAHSSILAWRISWIEEPDRLWSLGSQRVGHDWAQAWALFFHEVSVSKEEYKSISERCTGERLGNDLSPKPNTLAYWKTFDQGQDIGTIKHEQREITVNIIESPSGLGGQCRKRGKTSACAVLKAVLMEWSHGCYETQMLHLNHPTLFCCVPWESR